MSPHAAVPAASSSVAFPPLLLAESLSRYYPGRSGPWLGGRKATVKAWHDVSFRLAQGQTLAVVGESGCGKSTLARQLTLIESPTAGRLHIDGRLVAQAALPGQPAAAPPPRLDATARAALRHRVQMVFPNPYALLNPRKTVAQTLADPLQINTAGGVARHLEQVAHWMEIVGLRPEHAQRLTAPGQGEPPSPLDPPPGCVVFHQRCPHTGACCREQAPRLHTLGGQQVACHHAELL